MFKIAEELMQKIKEAVSINEPTIIDEADMNIYSFCAAGCGNYCGTCCASGCGTRCK